MLGFVPKHPVVEDLCDGTWRLHEGLCYFAPDGRAWAIPAGFLTDFGSVPAVVDWIIPRNSTVADPAYILHDHLYAAHRAKKDQCKSREDADQILYDALRLCGVGRVKAATIYYAVRAGGFLAWSSR